jgi:hypothetical protein
MLGEPNALVDFLDAELLAGQHGGDVDFLAMQAEPSAGGDENVAIMEGIGQFGLAVIGARCGGVELGRALHVQGLVRASGIELAQEGVKAL